MRSSFRRLLLAFSRDKPQSQFSLAFSARSSLEYRTSRRASSQASARLLHTWESRPPQTGASKDTNFLVIAPTTPRLPLSCPGCGAPTQTVLPAEAGFYTPTRSAVKKYLYPKDETTTKEESILSSAVNSVSPELRKHLGLDSLISKRPTTPLPPTVPVCDRCHNLIHYRVGQPICHPSLRSIEDTIAESPYKRNRIYHVLDAADFPMSLVPKLEQHLSLAHLRTQNRRSKSHHYVAGRKAELSFIITRSDLLAPKTEMVDAMMPQLREILRSALGSTGRHVRLGNLHCVSSKRGWRTKDIKKDIWDNGGACWLVGKVNVGKSNLFEAVFPKGRNENVNLGSIRQKTMHQDLVSSAFNQQSVELTAELKHDSAKLGIINEESSLPPPQPPTQYPVINEESLLPPTQYPVVNEESLLPPPQPPTQYPVMPIISELPGTTASPIRVPFGNGKGELIDLPGLARNTLDQYVQPEHRLEIVMKSRITPQRFVLKPGSSLLLGGLIRITPTTPGLIFMAHPFVPLTSHLTSTEKAIRIQNGDSHLQVPNITESSAKSKMASAGRFKLQSDVTKKYAGPLTRRDAAGLKTSVLPFIVYATDILIEGCGWVEVVAQVRKPKPVVDALSETAPIETAAPEFPEVEVFSPEGKSISQRQSLCAWLTGGPKKTPRGARPRRSMRSVKRQRKPRT